MRHLALLAIYALVAALALPSSILAQDDVTPATETPVPQAAPTQPAPATEPVPAVPAPAPEPQFLADERADARAPKPKAIAAASGSVRIADFSFTPATITVNVGDTVTWNNNGPTPHSATSPNGAFDTGILKKGQSGSHTFNEAGTYSYICTPHPFMKATVVVQAAQNGGGGGGTSSSESGSAGATGTTAGGGAEAAQSDDSGPALPKSGADSGALLVLGGLMLLLGITIHRRTVAASNDGH